MRGISIKLGMIDEAEGGCHSIDEGIFIAFIGGTAYTEETQDRIQGTEGDELAMHAFGAILKRKL